MRRCSSCGEIKDLGSFPSHKGKPLDKSYYCKPCCVRKTRDQYTKEEIKVKNRKHNLQHKYGLSLEDFDNLLEDQNYLCKICKEEKELVVDHCHNSGRVRGLLCRECNSGLGMFKDSILYLQAAQEYLNYE